MQVQPNSPQIVDCPVEARPEPEIKWFKDDELLESRPPHLEQTGKELMFMQTSDDDTGDYHCEATNYLGSLVSPRFKIEVQSSKCKLFFSISLDLLLSHIAPDAHVAAARDDLCVGRRREEQWRIGARHE